MPPRLKPSYQEEPRPIEEGYICPPLNSCHTHFVLVDSGTKGPAAWGTEIGLRTQLEATYTSGRGVPLVQSMSAQTVALGDVVGMVRVLSMPLVSS